MGDQQLRDQAEAVRARVRASREADLKVVADRARRYNAALAAEKTEPAGDGR